MKILAANDDIAHRPDLLVVGAGIIGSWCAFLAVNGGTRVLVVDRSMAGTGATQFSAGLDFPIGVSALRLELTQESETIVRNAEAEGHMSRLPIRTYPLYLLANLEKLEELRRIIAVGSVRLADAAEVRRARGVFPGLTLRAGQALFTGIACRVADAAGLARGLLAGAIQTGRCRLWEGVQVTEVRPDGEERVAVLSNGETVAAGAVVWAPGPWLKDPTGRTVARSENIRTKRIVSLHIDLPVRDDACVLFSPEDDAFLLPMADRNQWLFSYTRELWDVDPNDTQTSLTAEDLEAGRLVLRRLAPDYLSKSASGRAFCDAYGPSRNPVIARVQGDPKIVYAGAASGSGLRLAPAIASRALALLSQPCRPVRSPEILDSHYAHPLPFI